MAELFKVRMQLKNTGLSASLKMLAAKSPRMPSYLVNKACKNIAIRAERAMPRVPAAKMDAELEAAVATDLVLIKNGSRFSRDKRHRKFHFGPVGKGAFPQIPLLALIIQASVRPGSNYNVRTGNVFQRGASPFKGKSREAGRAAMLDEMRRVLSARHSSGGFFKVCAAVVKFVFLQATASSPIRTPVVEGIAVATEAQPGGGNVSKSIGRLAGGTVATGIRENARASFWVEATEPDTKGKPGGAIYSIAQPVWQRAVDEEARAIAVYAESLYAAAARESGLVIR